MVERLVILDNSVTADALKARLGAFETRLLQVYSPLVWVVDTSTVGAAALASEAGIAGVFDGPAPAELAGEDEGARLGIAAWNLRRTPAFEASREARTGEGRSWGDEGADPEG
jgi:hypothetical protein